MSHLLYQLPPRFIGWPHALQTIKTLNLMFTPMASLGGLFVLVYFACIIAVIIYLLRLLGRFVSAHERMAASLDIIARKLKDEAKP
jgi:hypothetical protein